MIGYLRTLWLFYRRHLRAAPLRELMAVTGVAAGVALLFAVQIAHHSITGSFEEITHGVAGAATLEVAARGPEGFGEQVVSQVQRTPGVRHAAPVLSVPIVASGPHGSRALTLVGADERIGALGGRLSGAFQHVFETSHRGFLLLSETSAHAIGARPGEHVAVQIAGRREQMTLDAIVPSAAIGPAAQSPVAAAPLAIAQNIAGLPGRVSRVLIEPAPGRFTALSRALTRRFGATLNVRPIDTEAQLLAGAAGAESQITLLFGAVSLLAGVVLAYNALLLAGEERRRFIVYLIETGARDSMIIASLCFDALILGLAGCAIGLFAGDLISLLAYRSLPGYIAAAFTLGGGRVIGAQTVAIALAGGLAAAFAAALLPALLTLRAGAASEPEAVGRILSLTRRAHLPQRLVFACGALLIGGCIALSALAPAATVLALVGLAAGLVICLPTILHRLLALAQTLARHTSDPAARLAVAELRGAPARSVALLATGTIAAFLMVLIGGSVANVQSAVRRGAGDLLASAQVWVKPGGPENVYTTQPFPYRAPLRRLQHLGAVQSVLPWRAAFLDLPGRRVWVLGMPPQLAAQIAPSQMLEGSLSLADRRLREGGWVALSQTIARAEHLRLGERVTLPTPAGWASFRLAATTANYGWLPGAIVMNGDDFARLWNGGAGTATGGPAGGAGAGVGGVAAGETANGLLVTLQPGVSDEAGRRAVQAALGPRSALGAQTTPERRAEVSSVLASTLTRLNDTTIIVLVTTIAAVIALMMAAVWQSRRRFHSLISIGMSFTQFARLIFYESGTVLLGGCAIGLIAGLAGQYLIDGWLHYTTGSPVQFAPAWGIGLLTLAIAAAISLAAALIAVLRTAGLQPHTAFSTE